ncbi:hypothetical protein IGI04_035467 [Brassica rapa subsp. trilocularis]|uniref:Uncharacterized protein n=1 Tax=Brassica rapa subsp. trilocularis TaxID=1813537 RepID=A0ABQ7LCM2_BRACM|nr:hypothetical protein IGI04_035467 [Brassica rapa subsp. trilocularis]
MRTGGGYGNAAAVAFKNGGVKNRGAGKIESRQVLAGKGRNTLQGVDCIQGTGCRVYQGRRLHRNAARKRGGLVRLSCVGPRWLVGSRFALSSIEAHGGDWSRIASLSIHTHPSFSLPFCRTLSGSGDGKKENGPETHETSNGTHGDVGKVDMCVLNPAPRNPCWKWGMGGCFSLI